MGPPETSAWEYPREDRSWHVEVEHWARASRRGASRAHGLRCPGRLTIVERLYEAEAVIITRSPLRITLGGGGTDLPSTRAVGGFLIGGAIDKYVYITIHDVRGRPDRQVLQPGAGALAEHLQHRSSARRCGWWRSTGARWRSPAWRTSRRAGLGSSRQLHDGPAEGAAHPQEAPDPPARAGRAGVPRRDRAAEGGDRQAGPVHRGVRRADLPGSRPTARSRPRRCRSPPRRSTTSKTTCCCSLLATRARPRRC